ncbi:unnamed protein product [Cyprideis torosa]|uniref:BZIP domain-containing protein n=1 Tax=Cyprideis torosa TaxID=163714 RepID=A0A7R8WCB3_9CRUS|nr:unnamed protein product [Cyprideis torosa]CAG0888273.1 unnamed protein product [Cyprideis torosa]
MFEGNLQSPSPQPLPSPLLQPPVHSPVHRVGHLTPPVPAQLYQPQSPAQFNRNQSPAQLNRPQSLAQFNRSQSIAQFNRPQMPAQFNRPQSLAQLNRIQSLAQISLSQSLAHLNQSQSLAHLNQPQLLARLCRPQLLAQLSRLLSPAQGTEASMADLWKMLFATPSAEDRMAAENRMTRSIAAAALQIGQATQQVFRPPPLPSLLATAITNLTTEAQSQVQRTEQEEDGPIDFSLSPANKGKCTTNSQPPPNTSAESSELLSPRHTLITGKRSTAQSTARLNSFSFEVTPSISRKSLTDSSSSAGSGLFLPAPVATWPIPAQPQVQATPTSIGALYSSRKRRRVVTPLPTSFPVIVNHAISRTASSTSGAQAQGPTSHLSNGSQTEATGSLSKSGIQGPGSVQSRGSFSPSINRTHAQTSPSPSTSGTQRQGPIQPHGSSSPSISGAGTQGSLSSTSTSGTERPLPSTDGTHLLQKSPSPSASETQAQRSPSPSTSGTQHSLDSYEEDSDNFENQSLDTPFNGITTRPEFKGEFETLKALQKLYALSSEFGCLSLLSNANIIASESLDPGGGPFIRLDSAPPRTVLPFTRRAGAPPRTVPRPRFSIPVMKLVYYAASQEARWLMTFNDLPDQALFTGVGRNGKRVRPFKAYPADPEIFSSRCIPNDRELTPTERAMLQESSARWEEFKKHTLADISQGLRKRPTIGSNSNVGSSTAGLESTSDGASCAVAPGAGALQSEGHASPRSEGSLAESEEDKAYREKRNKNNLAAKRSRDNRREKEHLLAARLRFLEIERQAYIQELSANVDRLRCSVCRRCWGPLV